MFIAAFRNQYKLCVVNVQPIRTCALNFKQLYMISLWRYLPETKREIIVINLIR